MSSSVIKRFHQRLLAEDDLEGALQVLRDGGYSKVQSMKALAETGRCGFAEAKAAVDKSVVWVDVYQRDSEFHDDLEAEIKRAQPPSDDQGLAPDD